MIGKPVAGLPPDSVFALSDHMLLDRITRAECDISMKEWGKILDISGESHHMIA